MTDLENPYAGQGAVLLDIGGNIGALVVTMPAAMEGREVELRPILRGDHQDGGHDREHDHAPPGTGPHSHRHPHVGVLGRPTSSGMVYSLVYPTVTEGQYELALLPAGDVVMTVAVRGSAVTQANWPT
jgi:hypothetical protein